MWNEKAIKVDLFAFGPPPSCPEIAAIPEGKRIARFVEAIEAEVVHLIRAEAGRWPANQHEIHFQPSLCDLPRIRAAVSYVGSKLILPSRAQGL